MPPDRERLPKMCRPFVAEGGIVLPRSPFTFACFRFLALCIGFGVLTLQAAAQQSTGTSKEKRAAGEGKEQAKPSRSTKLAVLPIERIIGPYIPVQEPLTPLTNAQRRQIYVRQTFLTAGSYIARSFSAGLDQARGQPHGWGGGIPGYGRRYAARYGQFVVQNSLVAAGNALLGYEPRYDFCRCDGFISGRAPCTRYRETS